MSHSEKFNLTWLDGFLQNELIQNHSFVPIFHHVMPKIVSAWLLEPFIEYLSLKLHLNCELMQLFPDEMHFQDT